MRVPSWGHECSDSVPKEGRLLWPCTVLVDSKQCVSFSLHVRVRPAGEARRVEPAQCQRSGQKTLQASAQSLLSLGPSPRPKEASGSPACSGPVRVTWRCPGAPSRSGSQQGGDAGTRRLEYPSPPEYVPSLMRICSPGTFFIFHMLYVTFGFDFEPSVHEKPFSTAAVIREEARRKRALSPFLAMALLLHQGPAGVT